MTTIYHDIQAVATTTLITKGGNQGGSINKITIANHDNTDHVIVKLYLYDGTNTFTIIKEKEIAVKTSLVLSDNISFDSNTFNLRITTSGTTPLITVIIK